MHYVDEWIMLFSSDTHNDSACIPPIVIVAVAANVTPTIPFFHELLMRCPQQTSRVFVLVRIFHQAQYKYVTTSVQIVVGTWHMAVSQHAVFQHFVVYDQISSIYDIDFRILI